MPRQRRPPEKSAYDEDTKRCPIALGLLAPASLYILAIVAYPLVDTIILPFTNAALRPDYNFVGWANYPRIFGAGNFTEIIIRTFIWTFLSVGLKLLIGMCAAVLLSAAVPGQTLIRILTMPPWVVPMAIGIFMWGWMYNGQFGRHRHRRCTRQ